MGLVQTTAKLFGFKLVPASDELPATPVTPANDDGALQIEAPVTGLYVDLDASYRSELDLIHKYRQMALQPELENAINDIIDEAIVHDTDSGEIVKINLDRLQVSDKIKGLISEEFNNVIKLLDFNNFGDEIFRKWYVDGRLYYNVVIDKDNVTSG
ncbi:MAG: portal protein, partial [Candidatus Dormibacteria bacterium]